MRKSTRSYVVVLGMGVHPLSPGTALAQWAVLLALTVPAACKSQSHIGEPRQIRVTPPLFELKLKVNAKRSVDDLGTPHNMAGLTTDRSSMYSSTVLQTNEINPSTAERVPSTTVKTTETTQILTAGSPLTTTPEHTTTTTPVPLSSRTTKIVTRSATTSTMEAAPSSENSADDFDHELAIIFGSMLGAMLLVFFCFGVIRCYRKEKMEFNKTQQNFTR